MFKWKALLAIACVLSCVTAHADPISAFNHFPGGEVYPNQIPGPELPAAPPAPDDVPNMPTAPKALAEPPAQMGFSCARYYLYKGQRLECDSNVRQDGERLRPILASVPSAENELNIYQSNRRSIRNAAYWASAGLLVFILGFISERTFLAPASGGIGGPGSYIAAGGLGLAAGSFIYSLSLNHTNESHLGQAVQNYNQAKPSQPIELEFSTRIGF